MAQDANRPLSALHEDIVQRLVYAAEMSVVSNSDDILAKAPASAGPRIPEAMPQQSDAAAAVCLAVTGTVAPVMPNDRLATTIAFPGMAAGDDPSCLEQQRLAALNAILQGTHVP